MQQLSDPTISPEDLRDIAHKLRLECIHGSDIVYMSRALLLIVADYLDALAGEVADTRIGVSATFERCAQILRDSRDLVEARSALSSAWRQWSVNGRSAVGIESKTSNS